MEQKQYRFINPKANVIPERILKGIRNNDIPDLLYVTKIRYYPQPEGHCFRAYESTRHTHQSQPVEIAHEIIKFMKTHIDKPLTLDEMAHHVHYSPNYLSTLFTQESGISPIRYFNRLKVQKACRMLELTDLRIKEISYMLSFSAPYYFTKVFTKYMHISPQVYRRNSRDMQLSSPHARKYPAIIQE